MRKIAIIGCSGSGKSTLAHVIGRKLNIDPIDLDTVRFTDGFTSEKRPYDDFMKDIANIADSKEWIVEGVYYNQKYHIEDVLWKNADMVIWLDIPLWLIEYRTWKRSIIRIFKHQTKPSGSPVNWKTEFGKDGLLRVLHKIHAATHEHYPNLLDKINKDTQIIHIKNRADLKKLLI